MDYFTFVSSHSCFTIKRVRILVVHDILHTPLWQQSEFTIVHAVIRAFNSIILYIRHCGSKVNGTEFTIVYVVLYYTLYIVYVVLYYTLYIVYVVLYYTFYCMCVCVCVCVCVRVQACPTLKQETSASSHYSTPCLLSTSRLPSSSSNTSEGVANVCCLP